MRLIDADELIKLTQKDMEFAFNNGFLDMAFEREHLIKVIRNQPTAYDIEKVVDELKKSKAIGADCVGEGFECVPLFKAIEIVKHGGVGKELD